MHTAFSSSKTVFDAAAIITYFVIGPCVTHCNIIKCISDILPILQDVFDGMASLTPKPQQTSCLCCMVGVSGGFLGCLLVCLQREQHNRKGQHFNEDSATLSPLYFRNFSQKSSLRHHFALWGRVQWTGIGAAELNGIDK